jgi:tetratricopeptide (TPR) repeat protein
MNNHIDALLGQAVQAFQSGNLQHAEQLLNRLLQTFPKNLPALQILGLVYASQNKHLEASNFFKKAIQVDSSNGVLQYNLAKSFDALGKNQDALLHYERATKLEPHNQDAWLSYAFSLCTLNRQQDALAKLNQASHALPDNVELSFYRGFVLHQLKQYLQAVESYEKALSLNSQYAEAWSNRGLSLAGLQNYAEAIDSYQRALELKPDYAEAQFNLALVYAEMRKFPEAKKYFKSALELLPSNPDMHNNLGHLLLANFQFEEGWKEYEWRFQSRFSNSPPLETTRPLWDGLAKSNRLFIWGEQGIGDQILHGSILPDLQKLPQKITVSLNKKLIPLFKRSFPSIQFVDIQHPLPSSEFDEHFPLASLGRHFRKNIQSFGVNTRPYLLVDGERVSRLKEQASSSGNLICGLSWGSVNPEFGMAKTAPIEDFLPVLSQKLDFVNLQYGEVGADIKRIEGLINKRIQCIDGLNVFDDIDGLAALIGACDFVVTISNSTAHIAGALGKETLLLVPFSIGKFWYWQDLDQISLWYPSVRVFVQTAQGSWLDPMNKIARYIGDKIE